MQIKTPRLFVSGMILATTLLAGQSLAAIISRTIVIDGNMADWVGIIDNPGQFSTDAEGRIDPADLDYQVQATGRDLRRFSFTYDATNLYFYVERYASVSNINDWWFYLDLNNDGFMVDGEPVLNIRWRGSNRQTERKLWSYNAVNDTTGDPLVDPISQLADGYDMPGSINSSTDLDPSTPTGGSSSGVEMETWIAWGTLGFSGPQSIGFHVASSNGSNLPNQLVDNMDGPGSNALSFVDLSLTKVPSAPIGISGLPVTYTLTVTNPSDSDATNIVVNDDLLAAGLTYVSDDSTATGTTYDPLTGDWSIPLVGATSSLSLNVEATAIVLFDTLFTNTAGITSSDIIDLDLTNDVATAQVTFGVGLVIEKQVGVVSDPVTGTVEPKSIPGAVLDYLIDITNLGPSNPEQVFFVDDLPSDVELFVGDLDGLGEPFEFIDGGITGTPSGLSYTFTSLASTTDSVEFSANGGATFDYVPMPDVDGYDGNVNAVRVSWQGIFANGASPSLRLRMRIRLL